MKHARGKNNTNDSHKTRRPASQAARAEGRPSSVRAEGTARAASAAAGSSRLEDKIKKKKKRSVFAAKLRAAALICICVGMVVLLGVGAGMYAAISKEVNDLDFEGIADNFSSTVYANDERGNSYEVEYLHSNGNREWIDSDKIPEIAKQAAVSIEDERFYKHRGVDIKRTAGAVIGWVGSKITGKSPSYGGSTITQQVVKNITNDRDKTAVRKIREMMRAVAFEKRFTKDEILTLYLNIAFFGNQCYGIEPASKVYFSKNAADLTLPQAAMIVGITQAPSRYDPFRKPEETIAKRNTVLMKMYELKKISKEEYDAAIASDLGVNSKYQSIHSSIYSYFVDQVINDVINDLQTQKGYSEQFATQQVFSGGLKIYTTMDGRIQEIMESVYTNTANFPAASKGTQSAMVIVDPSTGEIKGMVGGIGKKTESRGLNRATQGKRQPGSSIKPLSVYAPALEAGKISAATILRDEAITIGDWSPKNSYSGFKGDMSVRKAIEISANIPAVKTLQTLGLDASFNYMKNKFEFSSIVDTDKNLSSLGLGGLTNGVSTKEMAGAYSIFANGGMYIEPYTYTKVVDSTGKVLLEHKTEEKRIISEANAFIMSSFLKEVVNGSAGTGRNARLSGVTTYGKTGTTNDNCDKWFVGFTPYYVGAVWFGMDTMTPLTKVGITNNVSTQVWKKVMQEVHSGLEDRAIEQPDSVTAVSVCQKTGKLSSNGCGFAETEYFTRGTVPSKYCNNSHKGAAGASSGKKPSSQKPSADKPSATEQPLDGEMAHHPAENEPQQTNPATHAPTTAPTVAPTPKPHNTQPPASDGGDVITLD